MEGPIKNFIFIPVRIWHNYPLYKLTKKQLRTLIYAFKIVPMTEDHASAEKKAYIKKCYMKNRKRYENDRLVIQHIIDDMKKWNLKRIKSEELPRSKRNREFAKSSMRYFNMKGSTYSYIFDEDLSRNEILVLLWILKEMVNSKQRYHNYVVWNIIKEIWGSDVNPKYIQYFKSIISKYSSWNNIENETIIRDYKLVGRNIKIHFDEKSKK